jgi:hypothetical protein
MVNKMKKVALSVRIEPEAHALLVKQTETELRSQSEIINNLILTNLKSHEKESTKPKRK